MKSLHTQKPKSMKTKSKLYLLAMTAAALSLSATTTSGQVFNSLDVINNRAVAASPRMKEQLPDVARGGEKSFEVVPFK